jgi:hypothetical protein
MKMITKNADLVYRVYCDYGRGWMTWKSAAALLRKLDVPANQITGVLLGTIMIAGH